MLEILEKIELAVRRAAEHIAWHSRLPLDKLAQELAAMCAEERKKREETKG